MSSEVSLPPIAYPLLLLGMVGSPLILVVVVLLTTNGTVDLQDPGDWAGFAIFGVLAAIVLMITLRAFYRTLVGQRVPATPLLKIFALSAPLWWILGAFGGVLVAKSITAQVTEYRWDDFRVYCAEILGEAESATHSTCVEIANACDMEADLGKAPRNDCIDERMREHR